MNPFDKKSRPSHPGFNPPPVKEAGQLSEAESTEMIAASGDICPFLGARVIPVPNKSKLVTDPNGGVDLMMSFSPCLKDKCHLWDAHGSECSVKSQFHLLQEIKEGLAPLKNLFGNR